MNPKPKVKHRARRYEKSNNAVTINNETRESLTSNCSPRSSLNVDDILYEVKSLEQQLASVEEERDEYKDEVAFLKYQLSYRTQIQTLQKEMSQKKTVELQEKPKSTHNSKSVRFAANVTFDDQEFSEDEDVIDGIARTDLQESKQTVFNEQDYERLRAETDELRDVLWDFYQDDKIVGEKQWGLLIGDVRNDPSESLSSLVCRVLVSYEKLVEEYGILEEEKSKLYEEKIQLSNSMAKLREQFNDAVDSNIEEIEDLNAQNEHLSSHVNTIKAKNTESENALIKARGEHVDRLKQIIKSSKDSSFEKLLNTIKSDLIQAENELKEAKDSMKLDGNKNKVKRVQSLPLDLGNSLDKNKERFGLLRELNTCKSLQESQRELISKNLDEKLALETEVAELRRQIVLLRAERKVALKTTSKMCQTDLHEASIKENGESDDDLTRKLRDLEKKLEQVKEENLVLVREKTSLLMSFDANIEKRDALDKELAALQEKMKQNGGSNSVVEVKTVGTNTKSEKGFQAGYKGISEAKEDIEKLRVLGQDKHVTMLLREIEALKEKLQKSEDMAKTLQNCLKDLTDEKNDLLDSIEDLNEERAELQDSRSKLEKLLSENTKEKSVLDGINKVEQKKSKVHESLEMGKAKLVQLHLKVLGILSLCNGEKKEHKQKSVHTKSSVDVLISTLFSSVEKLSETIASFMQAHEKSSGESQSSREDLEKQMKNFTRKRDDVQKSFDEVKKELQLSRSDYQKLTTELGVLQEDLKTTILDRDELLELLDGMACENGTGDGKQELEKRVERIRVRNKSDGLKINERSNLKVVQEEPMIAKKANIDYAAFNDFKEEDGGDTEALVEENQKLKEIIESMLDVQKKMEAVLSTLSDANDKFKEEASLKQARQVNVHSIKKCFEIEPIGSESLTKEYKNAEFNRLYKAIRSTNEVLSVNLHRLQDEKTRTEHLQKSFVDLKEENTALTNRVEELAKEKKNTDMDILNLQNKLKISEKQLEKSNNEQKYLEGISDENNGRVKDLKFQVDSITEINQDLRETNSSLSASVKDYEKKMSTLTDRLSKLELEQGDLRKANQKMENQLTELDILRNKLESEVSELSAQKTELQKHLKEEQDLKTNIESQLSQSRTMISSLGDEISQLKEKISELEKSLGSSEKQLGSSEACESLRTDKEMENNSSEREKRVGELENEVSRLEKELQNSQRYVKAVSQENDLLRDSLSEWERNAGIMQEHLHQLSEDAENHNLGDAVNKTETTTETTNVNKDKSAKTFEVMEAEMDAVNEQFKTLTTDNKNLKDELASLKKENTASRNKNTELSTLNEKLSKELDKKNKENSKLIKDNKESRSKKKSEKFEKERSMLQSNVDKLNSENNMLKKSLINTFDEEKRISESLMKILDGTKVWRQNSEESKVNGDDFSDLSSLSASKPDLIRDSTEPKDDNMIAEHRKYLNDMSAIENNETEADVKDLLGNLLKGQYNLKNYCNEVAKAFKERCTMKDEVDGGSTINDDLKDAKAEIERLGERNKELEGNGEKFEKLQAVFRALVLLVNDKKGAEKKSGQVTEGPTRIVDYIKNIKTQHAKLTEEKENLEKNVVDLQHEIKEHEARAKQQQSKNSTKNVSSVKKDISEDKEKVLNKLLLSTARNKARLLEKLHEIFDELSEVSWKFEKENVETGSNLEKIRNELSESIKHVERFKKSIAHDRPVTAIADSVEEKDPNLELAKENEELLGRISTMQSSRRREAKDHKDELLKMEKDKVEALKAEEVKWKEEIATVRDDLEKKMKEKDQAANEVKRSLKEELSQSKLEVRRVSDEHEATERTARIASEKFEKQLKSLKTEMDEKLLENETKLRKAEMDLKEAAEISEREISKLRKNLADVDDELRILTEEKTKLLSDLESIKHDSTTSKQEVEKLKVTLDIAHQESNEIEEKLQRTIMQQKDRFEIAIRNSEENHEEEKERLKYEISKLERELENNQQQKMNGGNVGSRRNGSKTASTIRHNQIEKSRMVNTTENVASAYPVNKGHQKSVEPQKKRSVNGREAQTSNVSKPRVKDQFMSTDGRGQITRDQYSARDKATSRDLAERNDPNRKAMENTRNTTEIVVEAYPARQPVPNSQSEIKGEKKRFVQKDPPKYQSNSNSPREPFALTIPRGQQHAASKPNATLPQVTMEGEGKSSEARRTVKTDRHGFQDQAQSANTNVFRQPSTGSDDVFMTNQFRAKSNANSHGNKTGDSDNSTKQIKPNILREQQQQLPKSYV
ncbi:uncharacterized protein PFB0765w-like isoform X2 [Xenia sp. Carnegie-2017]|uniref:uncharacterized protein PFB0765w-like isoform X2 n=1 Tax=Xenia sp. Carnegie-2017 TaxID=2897299 RepID=UPI001F045F5D|nr:uncharacterized protein PFB0765w-like isoform X2 [Xenia sp. Carnegie-2017]XP_046840528.1 uncharacterized protein PFB0765w-like isoform X2 [Xenia sp. Carnegie-2017]